MNALTQDAARTEPADLTQGIEASGRELEAPEVQALLETGRPQGYQEGNRLPLPAGIDARHFLYKPAAPAMDVAAATVLADAVKEIVFEAGLHPGQVELVLPKQLPSAALLAFEQLAAVLLAVPCVRDRVASIVVCEQALPHTDPGYEGSAFLSLVLHTGPEPYYLQTLHSTVGPAGQDLLTTSRVLRVGDWVVFDPTTPHLAVPLYGSHESLLVLLQVELKDDTDQDRAAIVQALPPASRDRCVSLCRADLD